MVLHSNIEMPTRNIEDIKQLYAAAFSGDFLNKIMDLIASRIAGVAVLFFGEDTVNPSGNFLLHRGLDADATRSFSVDLAADSVWFARQWQQDVGHVYHHRELLDLEEFKQTRFYTDWLSRRGAFEAAIGVVFFRQGTRQLALEIRYPEAEEKSTAPAAHALLSTLAPHIENAARILNLKLKQTNAELECGRALELMHFPTFLIDADCLVQRMNHRAEALLRKGDSLFSGADERLHAIEPEADRELKSTVRDMAVDVGMVSTRLKLERTKRQSGLFLTLMRLEHAVPASGNKDGLFCGEDHVQIAVIAQHFEQKLKLTHDTLWKTFGMTTKESELAVSLLQGRTVSELAREKDMSKQTLRNQLCAIMRKTGTNRQVQLVRTLTLLALSGPA